MKNQRLIYILIAIGVILFIPFIAMKFSNEVNWTGSDFLIMGILLLGTGLICEFILRKVKKTKDRLVFCGIVLLLFLLVWAELAVGLF